MKEFYYCYSYPLKYFLISGGEFSIVSGIHPKTNKKYWVFEKNEKLDRLLTEWQSRKH